MIETNIVEFFFEVVIKQIIHLRIKVFNFTNIKGTNYQKLFYIIFTNERE